MAFFQQPPTLANTYELDRPLREHLQRVLPGDTLAAVEPQLAEMGRAATSELAALATRAETDEPRHVRYDPWGNRLDAIEMSPAWHALHAVQAEAGLCALPYEDAHGEHARVIQHALVHLYAPSSATYTCPMAMTDGAARVLSDHAEPELRDRVVPRLTSRDPDTAWTSGQWMTEREGGSDVSHTATSARQDADGTWRLWGTKWFTSATTSDCALALARPEGAAEGSSGLGLFLIERAHPSTGEPQIGNTILINRLKDKLGTRSMPTAELSLQGAVATPVAGTEHGLRKMTGMLNVTRFHNAMSAAAGMRRAVDWATAYAQVRESFGSRLLDLPAHRETLAAMAVEAEAAFALTLRVSQLLGRVEAGEAGEDEAALLRGLTPIAKLLTAKDAVAQASEALEALGGPGYIEETGFPALLRNSQVLPIWEGTTNVLSLDLLRAAQKSDALSSLLADVTTRVEAADQPPLAEAVRLAAAERDALAEQATGWASADPELVQAGARAFAMRLGRCYAAALLCEHAGYRLAKYGDQRAVVAARRYAQRWLSRQPPGPPQPGQLEESLSLLS
jgi:alkylation response protein AidB-like acyl-CoA dehydrogenase